MDLRSALAGSIGFDKLLSDSLQGRFLRSHLSIALIGMFALAIAIGTIGFLGNNARELAFKQGPTAQASLKVLNGIQSSLVAMRGWIALGDPKYRQKRQQAWQNDIDPAVEELRRLTINADSRQFNRILGVLADLNEAQWWIEDVAHTPGNQPARALYDDQGNLLKKNILRAIIGLIDGATRNNQTINDKSLLATLYQLRVHFAESHSLLGRYLDTAEAHYKVDFEAAIKHVDRSLFEIGRHTQFDENAQQLVSFLETELIVYKNLTKRIFTLREKLSWNVAQHALLTDAVPLAESSIKMLRDLSTHYSSAMRMQAKRVDKISWIAVAVTVILLIIIGLLAIVLSLSGSKQLVKPIQSLVEAAHDLAAGKLNQKIATSGLDELDDLIVSFNQMHSELRISQETLENTNRNLEGKIKERTSFLQRVIDSNPNFIFVKDRDSRFVLANKSIANAYGSTVDGLVGSLDSDFNLNTEESQDSHRDDVEVIDGQCDKFILEEKFTTAEGVERWLQITKRPLFEEDGSVHQFLGVASDITERKQAEEDLQKLSRAVEASSSAVVMTDSDGCIEYINPKFTDITGYSRNEAMGQNPRYLLQSGHTPDSIYDEIRDTICSSGEWKGDLRNKKKDGTLYWERCSISCIRNLSGKVTHYVGIQDDVTHEYELTEQLSYQATHDVLTGLINRREFEHRAERLLSMTRQNKTEHVMCFMDLDRFKIVNDSCGHTAGDELLRQLSLILQKKVRKRDTLARLGGDEFAILMEHCSLDNASRVATSILDAIQDYHFNWEGQSFRVGVSLGLVAITEAMSDLTQLLKQADAACYMAKDSGRNRLHVYHPEDNEIAQRQGEMQWVPRIYQALEEDLFCLYAQAIVPLDNRIDTHYELLIRMKAEEGMVIPPGAFLPAAERYNLMLQLDRWVVEQAVKTLVGNPDFLSHITFVSVNLSGQSLTDESFLEFIVALLQGSELKGNKICFEITETAAIANMTTAIRFISTLKQFGCQFALDDFGSGLSSFGYLKNLPVDYLKIDGIFVKDMVDDPIDRAMVKSINDIGQVMGMRTIAEFVENDEIMDMLRDVGVDYAQGYGIGKPMDFHELVRQSTHVSKNNIAVNSANL